MSLTTLALWALLLVCQNASFTIVSRARNSGSDAYHAIASVFSNGIWFFAFVFTFDLLTYAQEAESRGTLVAIGMVYIGATVFGSVVAGKFAREVIEKGSRRVGHYSN